MREAVVLTWDPIQGQPGLKLGLFACIYSNMEANKQHNPEKETYSFFFHSTHLNYGWDVKRTKCEQASMKSEVVYKKMRSSLWHVWCVKPKGIVVKRVTFFQHGWGFRGSSVELLKKRVMTIESKCWSRANNTHKSLMSFQVCDENLLQRCYMYCWDVLLYIKFGQYFVHSLHSLLIFLCTILTNQDCYWICICFTFLFLPQVSH